MLQINSDLTDIFLQVKINGDMALLQAIEMLLLQEEKVNPGKVFDQEFIEEHTEGYAAFTAHLQQQNIEELAGCLRYCIGTDKRNSCTS